MLLFLVGIILLSGQGQIGKVKGVEIDVREVGENKY